MEILKYLKIWKFKKTVASIFIWILILYVWVFIYSIVFEQDKLAIDWYNFGQLEKAKPSLEKISKKSNQIDGLKEFNERYKTNIKPIKNCYYISSYNWDKPYIFWFQLESLISKFVYFWKNYAYPKYNLPYYQVCFWGPSFGWWLGGGWCYDGNRHWFEYIISHPCDSR